MEDNEKEQLFEHYEKDGRKLLPKAVYFRTIEEVKAAFQKTTKSRHEYHLLGKFEVLRCGDIERLIQKRTDTAEESILYYASLEETYDIVKREHEATGHGGRDRMEELHKKYDNIPCHAIELYKSLCAECQKKKKRARVKGVVVRPILSNDIQALHVMPGLQVMPGFT
ncbi:hypothetical protein V1264_005664 [Littorina saxatilis]|uniref:Integrase zinc-binding domain-containing protein n=1 Tax=Littorina saxatilis TaxID=31220 RepID=A0AAN9G650_9CAEN